VREAAVICVGKPSAGWPAQNDKSILVATLIPERLAELTAALTSNGSFDFAQDDRVSEEGA
jgi:hypothetical protein